MLAPLIAATALVVALSLIVGQLALALGGPRRPSWTAAPVGLGILLAVMAPAAYLPGRVIIPLVVVAALTIGGIYRLVTVPETRPPWAELAYAIPAALLAFLPFLANGRTGVLGVSFDNDSATHLQFIDAIRSSSSAAHAGLDIFFPVAPHALMAGLSAIGFGSPVALTAVTVAIPVLTAFAGLAVLRHVPWWAKAVTVTVAAIPYMAAASLGSGAFAGPLVALFLVGLVGLLDEAAGRDSAHRFVPVAAVLAGAVSAASYTGITWLLVTVGLVALAWLSQFARRGGPAALGSAVSGLFYPVVVSFLATVFLVGPQLGRIQHFASTLSLHDVDLGALPGPAPKLQMLGVWLTGDHRFEPSEPALTHLGAALVGVLLVAAVLWSLRDRARLALPLAVLGPVVGSLLIEQGPPPAYTVARTLVLVAPLAFLLIGREAGDGAATLPFPARATTLGLAGLAAVLGMLSSQLVLRSSQVGANDHLRALEAIRPIVKGQPTLYLGLDDFASWELTGAPVKQPFLGAPTFPLVAAKGWSYGQTLDIDTIPSKTLDTFTYVVAPDVISTSAMPPNFHRVATKSVFAVWKRTGRTTPRLVLDEGQDGAAQFVCSTPEGRRIRAAGGEAAIRGPHVVAPVGPIARNEKKSVALNLTPGTWALSLRYTSNRAIRITGPGFDETVPPAMERVGSIWPVGNITVDRTGTVSLVFNPDYRAFSTRTATQVAPTQLVAQRNDPEIVAPLAQNCGRFVDWYRPASARPAAAAPQGETR